MDRNCENDISKPITSASSSVDRRVQDDLSHHKRFEYCSKRSSYRNSKKLTAVKVYTFVNESRHILVFGVPKVNLNQEVKRLFAKVGNIESIHVVTSEIANNQTVEVEQFTDCYHIIYEKTHSARRAKSFYDRRNFYGGILHISYAPEYETTEDVRRKIEQRRGEIKFRLKQRS